ncbi:MAG: VOC family protein [Paenibacillaceae bacterium]|nr:VOC family protein [Paenibacillaceae bacterium]
MSSYMPEGFHTVTPYLIGEGADKLIAFLQQAFDAVLIDRFADEDGKVRHAQVQIGNSMVEMSDGSETYSSMRSGIHLYVADTDASYARAIAAGGISLYEPADMHYGERSAGVQDPCGNHWYIATHLGEK